MVFQEKLIIVSLSAVSTMRDMKSLKELLALDREEIEKMASKPFRPSSLDVIVSMYSPHLYTPHRLAQINHYCRSQQQPLSFPHAAVNVPLPLPVPIPVPPNDQSSDSHNKKKRAMAADKVPCDDDNNNKRRAMTAEKVPYDDSNNNNKRKAMMAAGKVPCDESNNNKNKKKKKKPCESSQPSAEKEEKRRVLKGKRRCCRSSSEEEEEEEEIIKKKKPRKKGDGGASSSSNSTPELPERFREWIREMNGTEVEFVMRKELYKSDVNENNGRLSIPLLQIENKFLKDEENAELLKRDPHNSKSLIGMEVMVLHPDPVVKRTSKLVLKKWAMTNAVSYNLVTGWNNIVSLNKLKQGHQLHIWSFRVNAKLCFLLNKLS